MTQSLYEKIGGAAAVSAVVTDFYERLIDDNAVDYFFKDVGMSELLSHQTNFVARALGGPEIYEGRDLLQSHAGKGITDSAFEIIAKHLHESLIDAGVSVEDTQTIIELIASLRDQIVNIPYSQAD